LRVSGGPGPLLRATLVLVAIDLASYVVTSLLFPAPGPRGHRSESVLSHLMYALATAAVLLLYRC
jgi:hypothetical protein